jgi:hypothetical protein
MVLIWVCCVVIRDSYTTTSCTEVTRDETDNLTESISTKVYSHPFVALLCLSIDLTYYIQHVARYFILSPTPKSASSIQCSKVSSSSPQLRPRTDIQPSTYPNHRSPFRGRYHSNASHPKTRRVNSPSSHWNIDGIPLGRWTGN